MHTYSCSDVNQQSLFSEQSVQCVISDSQHLSAYVPKDVKLSSQRSKVCRKTSTNERTTSVATEGRSLPRAASTKVELNETTDAVLRETKLRCGCKVLKKFHDSVEESK